MSLSAPTSLAFLAASLVLAATPGPGVVYVVTRTLAQGRRAGLASVCGVALGNLGNALGASVGLAALFAVSSLAYGVVKYAGAAYLLYLGFRALQAPRCESGPPSSTGSCDAGRSCRDGCWVALLNPKTTLFFAAFLPQFIDPDRSALGQSAMLGVVFVAIAACTDLGYVLTASLVAPALMCRSSRRGAVGRWLTAAVYIGLGLITATADVRRPG